MRGKIPLLDPEYNRSSLGVRLVRPESLLSTSKISQSSAHLILLYEILLCLHWVQIYCLFFLALAKYQKCSDL